MVCSYNHLFLLTFPLNGTNAETAEVLKTSAVLCQKIYDQVLICT
ncbi:Uncharacterized protein dnm_037760 [Desulfonema magnum]|uniref:Uncharacterized protein n=1 Tax=Desulfonema magnum TaxID=45655 RepID=A0A975BL67_9BACT|nr:Uncharacterized protein dnm_037760 [Desulfonema magnum]